MLRGKNQIPSCCCLSVKLSLPKPLDEMQPNLLCGYSHEWGVQQQFFFAPFPGEGLKGQISFNFNLKVFQRYLYQTLCVYSQMKDAKHNRPDFYSVSWVMP